MAHDPDLLPADVVGTTIDVAPHKLNEWHENNPREGDVDAIACSLISNTQYAPIVVNRGSLTGRPNEVLAGNHTLRAFRKVAQEHPSDLTWTSIKIHVMDVDDEEATRILVADNRTFELGQGTDDETVRDLLSEFGTTGTGYTDADLDALNEAFAKNTETEAGTDEVDEDDPAPPNLNHRESAISYTILFDDEGQQEQWFEFVKLLKQDYPDPDLTVAERLIKHLEDREGAHA